MRNLIFLIFVVVFCDSCTQKKNGLTSETRLSDSLSLVNHEKQGLKDVTDFLGGECKYYEDSTRSTHGRKYLNIELSKSAFADKQVDKMMPMTIVAYRFYRNMRQDNHAYTNILVVLKSANRKAMGDFDVIDLNRLIDRMPTVFKSVEIIRDGRYNDLMNVLYPDSFSKQEQGKVVDSFRQMNNTSGEITRFELYGFMYQAKTLKGLLHVYGVLMRSKQNTDFSIDIDFATNSDTIYALKNRFW